MGVKIKAIDLKGQAKLKLVESAKEYVENTNEIFDDHWCVFDMDVKRGADEFADFDNAIEKALLLGYKIAYSNDAFELWFYLHYNFTDTQHLRSFYYTELGKKYDFCKRCIKSFSRMKVRHKKEQLKGQSYYLIGKGIFHFINKILIQKYMNW